MLDFKRAINGEECKNRVYIICKTEVEEVLLALMLTHKGIVAGLKHIVDSSFFDYPTRWIYDAILELYFKGKAQDIVSVSDFLEERKMLEKVGGRDYINYLLRPRDGFVLHSVFKITYW